MPGSAHEVLVVALREQPALLGALVEKLTGVALPRGLEPVDSAVRFIKTAEVRPDLLFLRPGKEWAIVELQGRRDPAKRRRWLLAASALLDQTGALGEVIVITARSDVARWALKVAHHRSRLGTKLALTPVVLHLGLSDCEALLDEQRPELSLFAAWAMQSRHGPKARAVVERAIELTARLPAPLRRAQMRAIVSVLSEPMLAMLREAAMNPDKIPETPAARRTRLFLEAQGRKRGRIEGEAKGRAEGKQEVLHMLREASMNPDKIPETPAARRTRLFLEAQGRKRGRIEGEVKGRAEGEAKGEAKGRADGKREAVLALLKVRGLSVAAEDLAALHGCADIALLDQWIVKAATATSASDVFGTGARPRTTRAPQRRTSGTRKKPPARPKHKRPA